MIKLDNVTIKYGDYIAVNGLSFSIADGECLGIIGPNGSGKSTLIKGISGFLKTSSGNIYIDNKDINSMKPKEKARKLSFVPEETSTMFSFTVKEMVLMGRYPYHGRFGGETPEDLKIAVDYMRLLGIENYAERNYNELSTGEKQRVIITRALCQQSDIILLDEPTSHLDISHQVEILDIIKKLNREKKLTIIVIMHDLNLASEYCDRIIMMNKGEVFADGRPEEVLTYQSIEKVYKAVVIVNKNPISGKPHVLVVPGIMNGTGKN